MIVLVLFWLNVVIEFRDYETMDACLIAKQQLEQDHFYQPFGVECLRSESDKRSSKA